MPIPKLTEHGLLPDGVHDCTLLELQEAFGVNRWVQDPSVEVRREVLCPQRRQLFEKLEEYVEGLRRTGIVVALIIDGSFVTDKPDPNDIDLILVLPPQHDFMAKLPHQAYDLVSKQRVKQTGYPFDMVPLIEGSELYGETLAFFQKVRDRPRLTKGLLRVRP